MELQFRPYQKDVIKQIGTAFSENHKKILVVLPCGAGKTVLFAGMANASQMNGKTVWFLVHRKELLDQTVKTFERFGITLVTITIGMVATMANHLDKYPKPDFIIFDEAQHSTAKQWLKIISAYPTAYLIGLTATPCRLDGKPLGDIYATMIEGITAKELIQQGYLAEYKYFAPTVTDLSSLGKRGADFNQEQATELLATRAVFGDVISHYRQLVDGKQAICYCSSIRHSQATAEAFTQAGITAIHFDGNTPKKERDDIIQRFRNHEIQILCNVDLISEGFDVPDCECCILLRPTMSLSLFIQQSMRCMRPKPNKTAIILDHVNNYTRFGLPDEQREWSLSSKIKPRESHAEDGMLKVRMCKYCFCTYESKLGKCPYCGAEYEATQQEIKNVKEIQLEEIKERKQAETTDRVKNYEKADECKSMAELVAFAKKKGYKPQWAYIQGKQRGWFKSSK